MGSLMAGWDSPAQDPKLVKTRRNKSFTKGEIETFWKSKKQKEEEHLRDISLLSPPTQKMIIEEAVKRREGTSTEPLSTTEKALLDTESETSLEKIIQKNGWWISSNWAFLNEPPVIAPEGTAQKYASQFHVANVTGSDTSHGRSGISA